MMKTVTLHSQNTGRPVFLWCFTEWNAKFPHAISSRSLRFFVVKSGERALFSPRLSQTSNNSMSRCPEMGLPLDNDMQESNMKKATLSPPQRFGTAPLALCAALVAQGFTLAAMASGTQSTDVEAIFPSSLPTLSFPLAPTQSTAQPAPSDPPQRHAPRCSSASRAKVLTKPSSGQPCAVKASSASPTAMVSVPSV